jgi:hypothetical protein
VQKGVVCSSVEPDESSPEDFNREIAAFEIYTVEVGDLEFAARSLSV